MRFFFLHKSLCSFFFEYKIKVCTALILFMFIASCKRDIDDECPKCPRVTSVTPNATHFNDTVLISGKHLLPNPNYNDVLQVKFNGYLIPDEYIIENYDDSIRLIIPKGTQSGPVTVDINVADELVSAGSANFTYLYKYTVSTLAGSGTQGSLDSPDLLSAQFEEMHQMVINPVNNDLIIIDYLYVPSTFRVRQVSLIDGVTTLYSSPDIRNGLACDASGQIYIATRDNGTSCRIKKLVYATNWSASPYAGTGTCGYIDGSLTVAQFEIVRDMFVDANNNLFLGEMARLRKITSAGIVSTVTGGTTTGYMDGPAASALFLNVASLDFDGNGNIYIADNSDQRIRMLSASGVVSTIAGTGTQGYSNGPALTSELTFPGGITTDNAGNLYFVDGSRHNIRKLDLNASQVSIFAGTSNGSVAGYANGDLSVARFNLPYKLAFNKNLNILYVLDRGNFMIRQIMFE